MPKIGLVLTLFLFVYCHSSLGQTDSTQIRNLDSLYQNWAEDRLFIDVKMVSSDQDTIFEFENHSSDSVYISRLAAIPTVINLTYNKHVKRFIELYVVKRKKQVELMLGLADYYFPIFEEILIKEGLPLELKYLPVIESGLNPVATSRVGAQGLWQFMYRTAKSYGLEINSYVDERWDPVKSSQAAVNYLKDLFDIYGDWYLVIAAYNCGPGNVNKAIRRSGGKRNYWDIYYHLPRETRGYVPAFIGAIYSMNFHHAHGIVAALSEIPPLVDTIWVDKDLHFKQIAEVLQIPSALVQKLNPQYRRNIVPGVGGPYPLQLPIEFVADFITLQDSVSAYNRQKYFSQANLNKSPQYSSYIPDPPKGDFHELNYTIKSGDNLGFIAEWYDVGLSRLKYWNNIYGNRIRAGQKLKVYVPKDKLDRYKNVNGLSFAEKQKNEGKGQTVTVSKQKKVVDLGGDFIVYRVKSGDNFWTIAKKYPGVSNTDIMNLNGISNTKLKIGQILKIAPKRKLP